MAVNKNEEVFPSQYRGGSRLADLLPRPSIPYDRPKTFFDVFRRISFPSQVFEEHLTTIHHTPNSDQEHPTNVAISQDVQVAMSPDDICSFIDGVFQIDEAVVDNYLNELSLETREQDRSEDSDEEEFLSDVELETADVVNDRPDPCKGRQSVSLEAESAAPTGQLEEQGIVRDEFSQEIFNGLETASEDFFDAENPKTHTHMALPEIPVGLIDNEDISQKDGMLESVNPLQMTELAVLVSPKDVALESGNSLQKTELAGLESPKDVSLESGNSLQKTQRADMKQSDEFAKIGAGIAPKFELSSAIATICANDSLHCECKDENSRRCCLNPILEELKTIKMFLSTISPELERIVSYHQMSQNHRIDSVMDERLDSLNKQLEDSQTLWRTMHEEIASIERTLPKK